MDHPLLAVTNRGEIVVLAAGGSESRALHAKGQWPTWRPGSDEYAATVLAADGEMELVTASLHGITLGSIVRSPAEEPIAPRVHHYALWSPGGSRLAYVTREGDALALGVADAAGGEAWPNLVRGAPIFSAWSGDSRYLIVHAGLSLHVVDALRGQLLRTVSTEASGFRVAGVGTDALVYGEAEGGVTRLLHARIEGGPSTDLGAFDGGVALATRPGSSDLGIAVTRSPQSAAFDELWLLDPERSDREKLARGPFAAFYWAPAGDRIALIVPAQSGDARYYVRIIDTHGVQIAASEAFVPSQDMRIQLGFFDQYVHSHGPWLPDGSSLLVAGRLVDDSVHGSLGDPVGDCLFAWDGKPRSALQRICPAQLGVAQPAPPSSG